MASIGTINKSEVKMYKATPQWQTILQVIAMVAGFIVFSMNQAERFAKVEERQENYKNTYEKDRIQLDFRINKMDDKQDKILEKQEQLRVLIENKQNRQ